MGLSEYERLFILREAAKSGRNPVCTDETLKLLLEQAKKIHARRYLEIGAGEGLTSLVFALHAGVEVTAIEKDPSRIQKAKQNFARFGVENILLLEEDAAEALPRLETGFDLIFLDGPKVQYRRYFPDCKRLLRTGGVLVSDDVFFLGKDREAVPQKRKMLFQHLEEYRKLLESDPDFTTEYFEIGEGVAVSTKVSDGCGK